MALPDLLGDVSQVPGKRVRQVGKRSKNPPGSAESGRSPDALRSSPPAEATDEDRVRQVEDALFEAALGGNVTAATFYLCNRAPERWRPVQKIPTEDRDRLNMALTTAELIRAAREHGFRAGRSDSPEATG